MFFTCFVCDSQHLSGLCFQNRKVLLSGCLVGAGCFGSELDDFKGVIKLIIKDSNFEDKNNICSSRFEVLFSNSCILIGPLFYYSHLQFILFLPCCHYLHLLCVLMCSMLPAVYTLDYLFV